MMCPSVFRLISQMVGLLKVYLRAGGGVGLTAQDTDEMEAPDHTKGMTGGRKAS